MARPPSPAADRNLLFGILALQMDFISRDALITAMNVWVLDKTKTLGQILLEQGALRDDPHALIEALVQKHLELHGNNAEQSLAALSSAESIASELRHISDSELQASLTHVSTARPADEASHATCWSYVGMPTSSGQRFRILRPHRKGGLGEVFVAHDEELHREVALKEIQDQYADHPESRNRFLLEAEITGGLEHPGIVPVYGLGQYADGRPFYAMRFIKGDSLSDAIERFHDAEKPGRDGGERALGLRKLLGRFLDVCNAVAYAHSRGVLHRDLKPGNIMLGPYGETLVVDWGLAKPVGRPARAPAEERTLRPRSASGSLPTQMGSALGTPAYMSPEQAAGQIDQLGPASDVYSLGATLYNLLTGRPPVEGNDLGAILEKVRKGAFLPPRHIKKDIPPALEAICLKAMAHKPADRYDSPRALAEDIEKWLADEPVTAWREPWLVRSRRWLRRHRTLVAAAAALLLAAIPLSLMIAWNREEARRQAEADKQEIARQKDIALANEKAASEREAETKAVLDFVENRVFAAARPEGQEGGLGQAVSLRRAVEAALPFVVKSFKDQPLIEARLRQTLATSFWFLGDGKIAADQYEAAYRLYLAHRGPDDLDTLNSMNNLANSYYLLGRHAEALKLREETLARRKAVLGPHHPHTLASMNNLANTYEALGRHVEALQLREETLAVQSAKLGRDHPDTLLAMHNLAGSYTALGRHTEALRLREETLALRKAKLGPGHPDTLLTMLNLANSYSALGRHADAAKLQEEAVAKMKEKLGPDHPHTLVSMNNLANTYSAQGRHVEAAELHEKTLERMKATLGPDHPYTLQCMSNLADSYDNLGRNDEALKLYEKIVTLRKARLGAHHPDTLASMHNLANTYYALGRYADALKLHEETLVLKKAKLGPDHPATLRSMTNVANCYEAVGRQAEALKLREETLALWKTKLGPDHPDTLFSMWRLAVSLVQVGRGAQAVAIIDDCVQRAAGKAVDPRLLPGVMDLRLRHFEKLKQSEGCRQTAEMWENLNRADANSLYDAACMRAVTATVIRSADSSAVGIKQADAEAERAIAWLHKAVAAGFKDVRHIATDRDLDALRNRKDFKKLLADLAAGAAETN